MNFRGIMVPKGTPEEVISKLAEAAPRMFASPQVENKMREGGSPVHIMSREEVKEMWAARQKTLAELLKDL